MRPRLLVNLPEGWSDISSQVPDAGAMFVKGGPGATSALQISYGLNSVPSQTPITEDDLIHMAASSDFGVNFGQVIASHGGPSLFGHMGTAIYTGGKYPRVQVWFLSNGKDIIMASLVSAEPPDDLLLTEAQEIVQTLALVPGDPSNPSN